MKTEMPLGEYEIAKVAPSFMWRGGEGRKLKNLSYM